MRILAWLACFIAFQVDAESITTVKLDVQGMNCVTCPVTVRKALEKVPGVTFAQVDYAKKTATVIFDPAKATAEQLIKATTNVGFASTLKKDG